jgi:hypothetical protein
VAAVGEQVLVEQQTAVVAVQVVIYLAHLPLIQLLLILLQWVLEVLQAQVEAIQL